MNEEWQNISITLIIAVAILTAIFMFSSCTANENEQTRIAIEQCIKAGSSYISGHCIK
jgi:hypothetical protein